mmetsp:Transcript_36417/g.51486  ORF Transcript_36417/g.51486 Transcript_36417/m.51486 type:complete len:156 (+) Transcript_36417:663-1130(+)
MSFQPQSNQPVLPKIHKLLPGKPISLRPIISSSGTPTYGHLLKILRSFPVLPPTVQLFTFDAVSMYTNIPIWEGIQQIKQYISENHQHINTDLIADALHVVMRNNTFQFGNTFWTQLKGTAMGAAMAPPYASIFAAANQEKKLFSGKHPRLKLLK